MRVPSWEMLTPLFNAQRARIPITAGTTVHDLTSAANDRERRNREYLWAALESGLLRTVTTCGLSPQETALSMVWSGASARGYSMERIVDWMCRSTARLAGLTRAGEIDVGFQADLLVFDPSANHAERSYVRGSRTGSG
jgi:allantoinase